MLSKPEMNVTVRFVPPLIENEV